MRNALAVPGGGLALQASGWASAQNGSVMDGGMMSAGMWMGGWGGLWVPLLLVVVAVVGLLVWARTRRGK